jgi:acylphosphatase
MTGNLKLRSVQVKICGEVHDNTFKAWTEKNAEMLGLAGWVRSRCDGSVEAMFAGAAETVDEMISRCKSGPKGSQVEKVDVVREGCDQFTDEFDVLPTV